MSEKPQAARGQAWRWLLLAAYVAILIGLAVAWRDPSLRHWVQPESLSRLGRELASSPLGFFAVLAGYVVAVLIGMPILVLTSVGALVFPPWPGMAYAMSGMLLGALVTYGIGRWTGAQTMDRWTKGRLSLIQKHLHRRGLLTVIVVRVLPLAPFVMVNLVLGAMRVKLRDFLLGSFIGLLPATIGLFLLMDRLTAVWRSPSTSTFAALAGCVLLLIVVFWWLRKRLAKAA
ncbi:MAG: VTT domain-containing protein [Aquabacterium sp.]